MTNVNTSTYVEMIEKAMRRLESIWPAAILEDMQGKLYTLSRKDIDFATLDEFCAYKDKDVLLKYKEYGGSDDTDEEMIIFRQEGQKIVVAATKSNIERMSDFILNSHDAISN